MHCQLVSIVLYPRASVVVVYEDISDLSLIREIIRRDGNASQPFQNKLDEDNDSPP